MRKTILTAALLCAFLGTQAQEYYEKHVAFPAGAKYFPVHSKMRNRIAAMVKATILSGR